MKMREERRNDQVYAAEALIAAQIRTWPRVADSSMWVAGNSAKREDQDEI
jgi:hypothetical protein